MDDVTFYIILSIVGFFVVAYMLRYILGIGVLIKHTTAITQLLLKIAEKQGVSDADLKDIKDQLNA